MTPIWARPRALPPPKATPIRGRAVDGRAGTTVGEAIEVAAGEEMACLEVAQPAEAAQVGIGVTALDPHALTLHAARQLRERVTAERASLPGEQRVQQRHHQRRRAGDAALARDLRRELDAEIGPLDLELREQRAGDLGRALDPARLARVERGPRARRQADTERRAAVLVARIPDQVGPRRGRADDAAGLVGHRPILPPDAKPT